MSTGGEQRSAEVEATPDDVAALLTARTKDAEGNELGEWTAETRPTWEEVQTRIDIARQLVSLGLGPIPEGCLEGAETAVALRAAMLTEAAFWPEQIQSGQSTYEALREMYVEARAGLETCVVGRKGSAYELDVSGLTPWDLPLDWWQRDLEELRRVAGR